jgi:pyruvate/2-oxoglutarate dehydrogenase complex dihydrolipoamide acyltransferase (E2) component
VSAPAVLEVVMPQLGITVAEGTVVAWRKQPGDRVEADEAICDVSTDKVDSDVPAPAAGRVLELLVAVGTTVDVGTVIATIEVEGESAPAGAPSSVDLAPSSAADSAGTAAPQRRRTPDAAERHSPVVVRLAAELGVALEHVAGTGTGGRVRKEDVRAAATGAAGGAPAGGEAGGGEPAGGEAALYVPPAPGPLSRMRATIGEHMKRSLNEAATVTSWIEVDFGAVEERRRALGVTALPIVAAAAIRTLAQFGELNAWLEGDRHTLHSEVNLGIAVSLGADGLIVPVVRSAQRLGVVKLAERIADLAARARSGALSPDEVHAGTFTITNPGQFGTFMATPVINQPQVAILDVEAIVRRPVVVTVDGIEQVAIRPICVLGLSWDHRALDGVVAAQFLGALRARLQAGEGGADEE